MGQYYRSISIDKHQFLSPRDYGSGIKLMEHSWLENGFVNIVVDLLKPGSNWYKTKIVWAGDYMDENIFIDQIKCKGFFGKTLYDYCNEKNGKAPAIKKIIPRQQDGPVAKFLVNHTKKVFVNLATLPKCKDNWIIHPLPILTCSGNGRGGGDYYGSKRMVGKWAGNIISAEYTKPISYREIKPDFKE